MNPKTNDPVSIVHLGSFAEIAATPENGRAGKRFLSEPLGLSSCEISINRIPDGRGLGYTHKHRRNEEIYIIVGGAGLYHAEGKVYPVKEGSVVRLAPDVVRTLEAAPDSTLDYVCIQAPEGGMPYSYREDGVPVSPESPVKNPLPLHSPLVEFFAKQKQA